MTKFLFTVVLAGIFLVVHPAHGEEVKELNLVKNSGFEATSAFSTPTKGKWTLDGKKQAPEDWTLSSAFPGNLEIVETAAPEANRFIRIAAPPQRASHIYQPCPNIQMGRAYRVSLRYRGGPVDLEMYEYDQKGSLVAEHIFARGTANSAWQEFTGFYMLPNGITRISLAIVIPAGNKADLDDLRMIEFERSSEKINVRDFGASGSSFETAADTTKGSPVITVSHAGDFREGQEVTISKCLPHISDGLVWDATSGNREGNFKDQIELRGYDGSGGGASVYLLDFKGEPSPTFRWSNDLGQSWKSSVEVTGDWQELHADIKVKLRNLDYWNKPRLVSFTARDHLLTTIVKIDGQNITVADKVPLTAKGCLLQHNDSGPLQRAFNRAVGEQRDVFIPSGHYRLNRGLILNRPNGISVEGENEENTILDISAGQGTCINVDGGRSVTFRRLRFRGFSSFAERKEMGYLPANGYPHMWGFFARHCNAITFRNPERATVEKCHASGMSAECFYSSSKSRKGIQKPPAQHTKTITYRNCTVKDCARNAFNNNDFAENTSVLNCRIENIGGCAWEGASRFVKFSGNYVTNAGPVAMGNIRSREKHFDVLPSGQHIVSHNTFEGKLAYGNSYVTASSGATPVIITNNIFVNLNASAIEISGFGNVNNLPAGNTIITGNAIDLSCVSGESRNRIGIKVSSNDSTISNNQIYTRHGIDPKVTGLLIAEPAHNIIVSNNTIRGCKIGLKAIRTKGSIGKIIDSQTFRSNGRMPWSRRDTYLYKGYQIVWIPNYKEPDKLFDGPIIKTFDPDEGVFRLREDFDLKMNAVFVVRAPQGFSWNIHHNVISDCSQLVNINVFGGPTAMFDHNILKQSDPTNAEKAVEISGQFDRSNNQYSGFEKPQ